MKRVVITGLGAVTPVGNTVNDTFENLTAGVCGIETIKQFDTTSYKVHIAAEVKDFDPLQYMDKSDVRKSDIYTQFALAAAQMAMKDSGIQDTLPQDRLGVYVGSGIGGFQTFITETKKMLEKGPSRVSPFFIPMMISNMAAGMIAIQHRAKGPCLPVVTACATSTHSIGEAYRAIRHGYADAIIAGGSEASICEMAVAGFSNMMALSRTEDPQQASIPFDKRRNGFVMGEGAAMMILEEYDHAVKRGAQIYAEVCGYGNTCDAYHMTAPDPSAEGAARAIRLAAQEAGIGESDCRSLYINAHGTSTPPNDKCETDAIKQVFGKAAYDIAISSTKSMTGHMLGAAGAVEAVICVKTLQTGLIPPTIGYREKDPECDLDYTPNKAASRPVQYALSTSLGFGGHNGCLALKRTDS